VKRYVRVLFGAINSTKLHKLAFHLGDELRRRGNLTEADTSINEMLHKLCKVMYARTNKQVTTFEVQLLRCEQALARIISEDVDETTLSEVAVGTAAADSDSGSDFDDEVDAWGVAEDVEGDAAEDVEGETGSKKLSDLEGGVEGAAVESGPMMVGTATENSLSDAPAHDVAALLGNSAVAAAAPAAAAVRECVRVRGRRIRLDVVAAAAAGRLRALPALLGLAGDEYITVRNSAAVRAVFEWGALPRDQTVRAAEILHRKPWWDHVVYRAGPDWRMRRHGLVRLVLCAVGGSTCHALVVQRLVTAKERPGCVLNKHGCRRFKWLMDPETGQPALHVVARTDVQRLEHIVPDFEDPCERRGLFGLPGTFPETPVELSLQSFFSNKFFPWTGGLTYSSKGCYMLTPFVYSAVVAQVTTLMCWSPISTGYCRYRLFRVRTRPAHQCPSWAHLPQATPVLKKLIAPPWYLLVEEPECPIPVYETDTWVQRSPYEPTSGHNSPHAWALICCSITRRHKAGPDRQRLCPSSR